MTRAWVNLGKFGDILSTLPVLSEEHLRTGIPQPLVVAEKYASVLDGLDYVEPVIYDGHWQDLPGALKFAKRNFDRVECFQQFGIGMNFEKRRPSFQLDQWDRVGYLDKWDKIPLILPRSSPHKFSNKTILIADHSQSSPFFQKEEMVSLFMEWFPDHEIVRIAGKRVGNLIEVLPMMDAASLVVVVESSFLHLAKATTSPVIAFTADRPTMWHGSAWSSKFAFMCRYCDFDQRKDEIREAAMAAVNNLRTIVPETISTGRKHGYNPTIGVVDNIPVVIYRHHPDPKNWMTKLAIDVVTKSGVGETKDIILPEEIKSWSIEDPRIFYINKQAHLSYVVSRSEYGIFRCVQAYAKLVRKDGEFYLHGHVVPSVPGNDFSSMQKNWLPVVYEGKLWFVTGVSSGKQNCILVDGKKVVSTESCDAPSWGYGEIRGGSVCRLGGKSVRVFHSRVGSGHTHFRFRYYIGVSTINPEPPFNTISVNKHPIIAGNEKYTDCKHWKPNCALPYGIIPSNGEVIASVGINDCESATIRIPEAKIP